MRTRFDFTISRQRGVCVLHTTKAPQSHQFTTPKEHRQTDWLTVSACRFQTAHMGKGRKDQQRSRWEGRRGERWSSLLFGRFGMCEKLYNVFVSFFFSYRIAILWFYAGAELARKEVSSSSKGRPSVRQDRMSPSKAWWLRGGANQKRSGGVRTFNFSTERARNFTMHWEVFCYSFLRGFYLL